MPVAVYWGGAALLVWLGLREVNDATDNATKLLLAGSVAGGVFIIGKKAGAW